MQTLRVLAFVIVYIVAYFHGGYAEVAKYEKEANAHLAETVQKYEELLEREKVERERAVQIADKRMSDLNAVNDQYRALQLRLRTEGAGRKDSGAKADHCGISSELYHRRLEQVGELIREAGVLIKERDEIAVSYNALRLQCR